MSMHLFDLLNDCKHSQLISSHSLIDWDPLAYSLLYRPLHQSLQVGSQKDLRTDGTYTRSSTAQISAYFQGQNYLFHRQEKRSRPLLQTFSPHPIPLIDGFYQFFCHNYRIAKALEDFLQHCELHLNIN